MIYDIPGSSHGPAWLSHGWQLNGNLSIRTGFPFTVRASSDTSGTGENTPRGVEMGDRLRVTSPKGVGEGADMGGHRMIIENRHNNSKTFNHF